MSLSDSQPINGPPPTNSPVAPAAAEHADQSDAPDLNQASRRKAEPQDMGSGSTGSGQHSDAENKPRPARLMPRRNTGKTNPTAPAAPAPPPPPPAVAPPLSAPPPVRAASPINPKPLPQPASPPVPAGPSVPTEAPLPSGRSRTTGAGEHLAQQEAQRRKVPSWFASLTFHLVLLLVLALIPIKDIVSGPFTLMLGESGGDSIAEFQLGGDQIEENSIDMVELEPLDATVDPSEFVEQLELPSISLNNSSNTADAQLLQNLPFGIRNGLTGRTGALKDALLAKYGGTAETEAAVELGLQWLAKQQKSDGSWSLTGPYANGGSTENHTAATAMALNAFLGAGHTHLEGEYRENVKLGLEYLVLHQNSEGFYSTRPPSRHTMYAQAIATIAVIECYGLSKDEKYRASAMQAIAFAEWAQSQKKGWRYYPREDADLSVTGWYVMALITAKMAGLPVDEEKLQSVNEYLDTVAYEDDTRYSYKDIEKPSLSMTAEGLLCRIYLGWVRSDPSLLRAVQDDLLTNKPALGERVYSVYYWYYATQVMHHVGGKLWDEWNQEMRTVLPAMQERNGKEAGSWDPQKDMFGASGGRLYTTCLNLYCLEVYYRHLSIYDLE